MSKRTAHVNAKISSIIGADMVLEGDITTKDAIRIEGTVKGNIRSEGTIVVSPSGRIVGNLSAGSIMAGGIIEGEMFSEGKIEVAATGKITGNIKTKSLIIDENAIFQGQCIMNMNNLPSESVAKEDDKAE